MVQRLDKYGNTSTSDGSVVVIDENGNVKTFGGVTSVSVTSGTGISASVTNPTTTPNITITNTAPDQVVVLNSGTGISTSGTYPNFTITNSSPSSGGTVTSVAALTLGTTGTDLSSSVATGTTTPVITLNVPTASATNRGALSSTDWTTFNSKQNALTLTTTGTSGAATLTGATLNIPQYQAALTNPITGTGANGQVAYWTGTNTQTGSNNLFWDNANGRLGVGTNTPNSAFQIGSNIPGTAQTKLISVNDITTTDYSNAAFFNSNIATTRLGFVLSNSSSTNWANNHLAILVTGASHPNNNYFTNISGKGNDAGYGMIIGQGSQTTGLLIGTYGSNPVYLGTNNNARLSIFSNGNVGINTTTDAGQKFQLAGNQATTLAGSGDGFTLTRTGTYDNVTLTALATITDTTSNANRAKTGLYVNVTSSSTNIAIRTVGAVGVGVTPPSNSFASGYFSYLYAGATVNSAANYNLNVRSTISSFSAGNGGGMSFWGDDRGQAGANTAFAGIRGVKENGTYLNGLGALTFLTQASSAGLSTESTFAEVGRFTSGGNFLIGTTTNAGYKLDVNGTARVVGNLTNDGTIVSNNATMMTNGTTGGVSITTTNNRIYITAGANVRVTDIGSISGTLNMRTNGTIQSGAVFNFAGGLAGATGLGYNVNINSTNSTQTGGNVRILNIEPTLSTDNATSTFKGIYYNPTISGLLANTSHNAIETVTGNVILGSTSGSVGIGANTTINASAIVDVTSTTKGFLPPRMTTTQKNAISSPATGLMVYDTTLNKLCVFTGTVWETITSL